jgi:hypothetical protein
MPNAMEALAEALAPLLAQQQAVRFGLKHDASGTPISVGYSHGPGGLLTFPGVDPAVFSAMVQPTSILGQLAAVPSVYTNPTYWTITGVGADSGSEKQDVCDDAPVAGLMAGCLMTSVFGRYERATPELELNRLGARNDRADPLDLALVNSSIASSGIFGSGVQSAGAPGDVFTTRSAASSGSAMSASGGCFQRSCGPAPRRTTRLAAVTRSSPASRYWLTPVTATPKLVLSAATTTATSSTTATTASTAVGLAQIVPTVTNMYHQLYRRAELMGLLPVRWIIAMRSQMFYELTALWPCSYLSFRCATVIDGGNGMRGVIDAQDAIRFRDEMRAGKYLMIDGVRVEVQLDDGIPELSGNNSGGHFPAGCFSSDVYFIPMSVVGGRAVTYLEYFEYQNPSLQDALGNMILGRIEGAFLTWPRQTNQCVTWQTKVEPRLIMRTPWLAGRIQNVVYCPIQHEPEGFPSDPYFVNDGRTSRPGPSLYSQWQN